MSVSCRCTCSVCSYGQSEHVAQQRGSTAASAEPFASQSHPTPSIPSLSHCGTSATSCADATAATAFSKIDAFLET